MLRYVLLTLVAAVAAVLVVAATRPDVFRVERSLAIQAPPERIYAQLEDFRRWGGWSPYEQLDPQMKRSYEGAERGQGAVYAWDGNGRAGAGRMEIVEAVAPTLIRIQLDFVRPFAGRNTAEFRLAPKGDVTEVIWAMYGPDPFVGRLMGLFLDRDEMIGQDFETGLARLKASSEV